MNRNWKWMASTLALVTTQVFASGQSLPSDAQTSGIIKVWPELLEAVQSDTDLWGEQAIAQPDGPSFEFFKSKTPSFHYVDTDFQHYPIVLSGPRAKQKARLVSNGSGINLRANSRYWKDFGFPVTFRVGDTATTYGEDLHRLDGPRYYKGYLPVVQMAYRDGDAEYAMEAFTPVEKPLTDLGPVLLQFGLRSGSSGTLAADVGATGPLTAKDGSIRDAKGRLLVAFDGPWKWHAEQQRLTAALNGKTSATLAVFSIPLTPTLHFKADAATYARLRRECCDYWEALIKHGTMIETPETVVNNSWRAHIIANYMLVNGDRMHYSAGNQYEKLYVAEGGDAVKSLLVFNHLVDASQMIPPIFDFVRQDTRVHQTGLKLQLLSRYYWLTRDKKFVTAQRSRWKKFVDVVLNERETSGTGLLPRDRYAGDIATKVYSLNSNSNCWRGLREMATVLKDMGVDEESRKYSDVAGEFRNVILDAATRSIDRSTSVPFVPVALFGEVPVTGRLSASRLGGYYNLMVPYIIGSRIFGPGAEPETWMIDTLQQRGGICMGMIRGAGMNKMYGGITGGFNNLYTIRLTAAQCERDEVGRVLVSFYGKLAQGQTWDTYISGEGSGMAPYDEFGRPFYDPPNSAGNAYLLLMLRDMLVQDLDLDDDCVPETLRLLFATPGRWMEDGGKVRVERAPTAFGEVSVVAESKLSKGEVIMKVTAPSRNRPAKTFLRCRLPRDHKVVGASANGKKLSLDSKGSADVSQLTGNYSVRFEVR